LRRMKGWKSSMKRLKIQSDDLFFYLEIETLEIHCPSEADSSFGGEIRADFARHSVFHNSAARAALTRV